MSGSDGRYMSIDSGPSAVRSDSNKVSANVPGRSIGRPKLTAISLGARLASARAAPLSATPQPICRVPKEGGGEAAPRPPLPGGAPRPGGPRAAEPHRRGKEVGGGLDGGCPD